MTPTLPMTPSDTERDTERDTELEIGLRGFAVDPGRPPQLHGDVSYVAHETAVGRLLLAAGADGRLLASSFAPDDATESALLGRLARLVSPRVLRDPRSLDAARAALDRYLEGGSRDLFQLDVDLTLATPFQREVLPALAGATAYGQRTSYGVLAARIGRPNSARAVGSALGANPLCIVLPCHRVVSASGALTGYAGGLAAKEYLLALEAAHT